MNDPAAIRLERRDPAQDLMRYYAMQITPSLFGEWCLLRAWGRIGRKGQTWTEWFGSWEEAAEALRTLERRKRRRGYRENHKSIS